MNAVIVRLIDAPPSCRGFTILDDEGDYNVYINSRLSMEAREATYRHELEHIKNDDFYSGLPAQVIEEKVKK